MKSSQIAAQLYTLRQSCQTAEGFAASCAAVREIGYTAVQVSGIGPIPHEQVREICDANGLRIVVTHSPWDKIRDDPAEIARQHRIYGTDRVGVGCMPGDCWNSFEAQTAFARQMADAARVLREEYGLSLAYHNHRFEFTRFAQGVAMDALCDIFLEGGVDVILDLFWVQAAGASPLDWIRKLAGHMQVVHLKDMAVVDNHEVMAEVGEGNMNHPAILRALDDAGVSFAAVEQDTCRRAPIDCLRTSYENLMRWVEE